VIYSVLPRDVHAATVMSPEIALWWVRGLPGPLTPTHTQPSWILSGTTRVSWHKKGKTNLDLLEQEIVSGSGISWTICKSAPYT